MPRWQTMALVVIGFLFLNGCGEEEPVKKIDLAKREEIKVLKPPASVTYAYLPQYSHTVSHQRHYLLVQYLDHRAHRTPGFSRHL